MVKVPIDEVVDVIAVRHRVVPAVRAMDVTIRVPIALMTGRARVGVSGIDSDRAFVDVITMHRVEMSIVQIVDVAVVPDRAMATVRAVYMLVVGVNLVLVHRIPPGPWVMSKR
jgi:hypothetical protein